jgi:arylsulfatase A-like enzyme
MMAPSAHWLDYLKVVVIGAGVCAFVFAVSGTFRTTPRSTSTPLRASPNSHVSAKSSSTKPHIVFIMADDLGWNGIGSMDWLQSSDPHQFALQQLTPNLQGLATAGITLSNYYSQEVCTPSRATLLTGRYPVNTGMQFGVVEQYSKWGLNLTETTLAEVLKDNGYDTHAIGT